MTRFQECKLFDSTLPLAQEEKRKNGAASLVDCALEVVNQPFSTLPEGERKRELRVLCNR